MNKPSLAARLGVDKICVLDPFEDEDVLRNRFDVFLP
jgi:hypothetical protein